MDADSVPLWSHGTCVILLRWRAEVDGQRAQVDDQRVAGGPTEGLR